MRIATWNVNSVRTRLERVLAFLQRHQVDALAMQEIKCRPDQFPTQAFTQAGYEVAVVGQSRFNGVAIASRAGLVPIGKSLLHQPTFGEHDLVEARAIGARVGGVELWSLYLPHGRALDHPHMAYKLDFYRALAGQITNSLQVEPRQLSLYLGDFNVAPLDSDVWDIGEFSGQTHVSPAERQAFFSLEQAGLQEVSRPLVDGYTYWDYQRLRFVKDEGMRIDFAFASPALAPRIQAAHLDRDERKAKGASDHIPLILDLH